MVEILDGYDARLSVARSDLAPVKQAIAAEGVQQRERAEPVALTHTPVSDRTDVDRHACGPQCPRQVGIQGQPAHQCRHRGKKVIEHASAFIERLSPPHVARQHATGKEAVQRHQPTMVQRDRKRQTSHHDERLHSPDRYDGPA